MKNYILTLVFLSLATNFSFAQSSSISFSVNHVSLIEVFQEIEKNSIYSFAYNAGLEVFNSKISVEFENKDIEYILNQL